MADELNPGDQVVCLVRDKAIINAHEHDYDFEFVFDIITLYADGFILYVPDDLSLDDCMYLNDYNLNRFKIDKKFRDSRCYYITAYKVVRVYQKLDGMCCANCEDFYPMALANKDGKFFCFMCRTNPWR